MSDKPKTPKPGVLVLEYPFQVGDRKVTELMLDPQAAGWTMTNFEEVDREYNVKRESAGPVFAPQTETLFKKIVIAKLNRLTPEDLNGMAFSDAATALFRVARFLL